MFWFFLLSVRTLSDPEIQEILKTKNSKTGGYESFNNMLDKFNESTKLNIQKTGDITTSKLNILNEMVFTGKAMVIMTYDFLVASSYNTAINQDNEFKFLRYIRNGAAHYNKFNLKDEVGGWKIREDEIIEWNNKKISRALQGQEVFNNFISIFDIFILAQHFSEKLNLLDKQKT